MKKKDKTEEIKELPENIEESKTVSSNLNEKEDIEAVSYTHLFSIFSPLKPIAVVRFWTMQRFLKNFAVCSHMVKYQILAYKHSQFVLPQSHLWYKSSFHPYPYNCQC